jgi:hypothetical protein
MRPARGEPRRRSASWAALAAQKTKLVAGRTLDPEVGALGKQQLQLRRGNRPAVQVSLRFIARGALASCSRISTPSATVLILKARASAMMVDTSVQPAGLAGTRLVKDARMHRSAC